MMQRLLAGITVVFVLAAAAGEAFADGADTPVGPRGRLSGVCYGPFRDNEDPDAGIYPAGESVQQDLEFMARLTRGVRTYGATRILGEMALRCEKAGLDCYPGAWISSHRANNAKEIEGLVAMCTSGTARVRAVIVGNEVLLRKDQTEDQMIQYVREVKRRVRVPVTYAETWKVLLAHPALVQELDLLMVHIHPYWDGIASDDAPAYVMRICRQLQERFPGKRVVIGETGWPSEGPAVGQAVPGDRNQGRFLGEFIKLASEAGIDYFIFEAFDETWKVKFEGSAGAHWGIYASDGSIKPHNAGIVPPEASTGREIRRPPRTIRAKVIEDALPVYTDWDAGQDTFVPSGWMGDIKDILIDDACPTMPHAGATCIRVSYQPAGDRKWAGIYWQYPGGNWGRYPGYDLSGSAIVKLVFWARGETGGETVEFKIGGINRGLERDGQLPNQDSFGPVSSGIVKLAKEWKPYEIPLAGENLGSLIGGFCWVANAARNPGGCIFYLDDICLQQKSPEP